MKIENTFLIILVSFASCGNTNSKLQINDAETKNFYESSRQTVLSKNKIGEAFHFNGSDSTAKEIVVTYLGEVKMKNGEELKFVNSINYFSRVSDVLHSNSKVMIYNSKNHVIGYYYSGSDADAPSRIDGSDLVFSYNNERCNQTTKINFSDSIPKQMFVNCTERGGDMYNFVSGNINE